MERDARRPLLRVSRPHDMYEAISADGGGPLGGEGVHDHRIRAARGAITRCRFRRGRYAKSRSTYSRASNGAISVAFSPVPMKRTGMPSWSAIAKTMPPLAVLSSL